MRARVETKQPRTFQMRNVAMDALMQLTEDIKAARAAGRTGNKMVPGSKFQVSSSSNLS